MTETGSVCGSSDEPLIFRHIANVATHYHPPCKRECQHCLHTWLSMHCNEQVKVLIENSWNIRNDDLRKTETRDRQRSGREREIRGAICRQSVSTVTSSVPPWETFYRPQKRCEHYDWWYCQTLWSVFYIRVDIWQSRKMQMPHCLPFIALSSIVNHEGKKRLYFCDFARIFVI